MEILILELISLLSLTFSGLLMVFDVSWIRAVFLFLYILLVFLFFLWRNLREIRYVLVMGILFVLPFFLEMTIMNFYLTMIYTVILTFYYARKMGTLYPDELSFRFRVVYVLMIILALLGAASEGFRGYLLKGLPYMLIYFSSTIILNISLRHRAAGIDARRNRRRIAFYLLLAMAFSLVAGIEEVRRGFFDGVNKLMSAAFQGMLYVIYPIAYVLFWIFQKIGSLFNLKRNPEGNDTQALEQFTDDLEQTVSQVRDIPILNTILSILLLLVILYVIVKVIRSRKKDVSHDLPFEEFREYVRTSGEGRLLRRREKKPDGYKEEIRYYYRNYLRRLRKHAEIVPFDTTRSIRDKAKEHFPFSQEIRDIYARLRYGDLEADEEMVKAFKEYTEED